MVKFLGILVLIVLPIALVALAVGRRIEENEEKEMHDRAIREGLEALKRRVLVLEKLRSVRREKRG